MKKQKIFKVLKFLFSAFLLMSELFVLFWAFAFSELAFEQWGGIDEDVIAAGLLCSCIGMIVMAIYYLVNLGKIIPLIVAALLFLANIHYACIMLELEQLAIVVNGPMSIFAN